MPNKAKLDAVRKLREYDHAFLNTKGVEMFAELFGVKLTPTYHAADYGPKNPKGLRFDDGRKGDYGMDAAHAAELICDHLGIEYEHKMGRGFRLQAACNALEAHFKV
jgi:hypothetical protein